MTPSVAFPSTNSESEGYDALRELALNLRWSWNHASDVLWKAMDAELWQATQNPWNIIQTVPPARMSTLLADPELMAILRNLLEEKRSAEQSDAWFQQTHATAPLRSIAYFSMEFMLSEALPIYSGGLGNVAGDQLKAASDLGVPVVGVGLLYARGYFRQAIGPDGSQEALYPANEPGQLPLRPLLGPDGEWLRLQLHLPGFTLWLRTWEVQVGRTRLYLLDTNDPANTPAHRCITGELYGGGPEMRLQQELVLGIGGWRLLRAIGLDPEVCHLNEGHAAFAALERARCFMTENAASFAEALTATRAGNIFTTHTAVEAGFDRFAPELIDKYLRHYASDQLGVTLHDLLALGRCNAEDKTEPFTMAYLAIRASNAVSAVSALHEQVSRHIFQPLFPRWPVAKLPLRHVTNGIHVPTWDSAAADALWTEAAGKDRWLGDLDGLPARIRAMDPARIWQLRTLSRQALVEQIRLQYAQQVTEQNVTADTAEMPGTMFDPDILTLGFARRFAPYKRPNLLLHDPDRLMRILTHATRPAQLVLAGKAHPQDFGGQAMIQQWNAFACEPAMRSRVMFLRDYDMQQSQLLVQGVDVWINTPRRPWEACGTSGMKILANGGLNLSERDGWWAEAASPDVGWAIGDGCEHGNDSSVDADEADELYRLLEQDIIPEFYDRGADGMPQNWIKRIRESMARLTPQFSANRAVRNYVEAFYLPAAAAYGLRSANAGATSRKLQDWRATLSIKWPQIRFGRVSTDGMQDGCRIGVEVFLGEVSPDAIKVELYAEPRGDQASAQLPMIRQDGEAGAGGAAMYTGVITTDRPAADYTPRIIPSWPDAEVPLEISAILWRD